MPKSLKTFTRVHIAIQLYHKPSTQAVTVTTANENSKVYHALRQSGSVPQTVSCSETHRNLTRNDVKILGQQLNVITYGDVEVTTKLSS